MTLREALALIATPSDRGLPEPQPSRPPMTWEEAHACADAIREKGRGLLEAGRLASESKQILGPDFPRWLAAEFPDDQEFVALVMEVAESDEPTPERALTAFVNWMTGMEEAALSDWMRRGR